MSCIHIPSELEKIRLKIPLAENAKMAFVRASKHFRIQTHDNPDMSKTLAEQEDFINAQLSKENLLFESPERNKRRLALITQFQKQLSIKAFKEQEVLLKKMKTEGIPLAMILEDKKESQPFWYYTDQIFATDTGQYYENNKELYFIPAFFKNPQRKGEERLAIEQAENFGFKIQELFFKNEKQVFEGGDIRQMPGKKLFFMGYGIRSEFNACLSLAKKTGYYVLPIKLLQPQFYHLDCCFLPLPYDGAVIYEGEYLTDGTGKILLDDNNWPLLKPETETMSSESRALLRTLYAPERLVLLNKNEALAFATNAAIIQSLKDNRFKMFVNGNKRDLIEDENQAIVKHQISYLSYHLEQITKLTYGKLDIIEVPYATMHASGGSVRCTIQEVFCSNKNLLSHKRKGNHFAATADKTEMLIYTRHYSNFFTSKENLQFSDSLHKRAHSTSSRSAISLNI